MSNLWTKSDIDVDDHPKTHHLTALLKIEQAHTVGLLHCLWHFTFRYAWRDGNLEKFSTEAIARGAKWHGEAQLFISALQDAGWLDGLIVHDWLERAGKIIVDRIYNEQRRPTALNGVQRRNTAYNAARVEKSRVEKSRVEKKENTGAARFAKPSKKELEDYAASIGFKLDGQRFLDYYDSNGWKIGGKSPMKDWKAAIRTWQSRRNGETNGTGTHGRIKNQSVSAEAGKYAGITE